MRNRFPGTCYRCGEPVEAGDGHFEKKRRPFGWRTQHATCAIAYRGTEANGNGVRPGSVAEAEEIGRAVRDQGLLAALRELEVGAGGKP